MNPKRYRDLEIAKVIDNAFKQFKITDPNEKADITNSIIQQLDSSRTVSTYQKDEYASSSVYRANVRNALIDIISHLLGIKDSQATLNQMEGVSRNLIEASKAKLAEMQKTLIGFNDKIKESFTEGIDIGSHRNSIVKEGHLRVDFLDTMIKVEKVECVITPADSIYDEVSTSYSNNKEVLFKTGVGSDVFHVLSTCKKKPGQYIGGKFYEGLVLEFTLDTEPSIPRAISSKSSHNSNIALWEAYDESISDWIVLGTDQTMAEYSYADTSTDKTFNKYRIKLVFSEYEIRNKKFSYEALVHNIKLFKKNPAYLVEPGHFESKTYPINKGFYKVDFDANFTGWATFRIRFNGRPNDVWSGDADYGLKKNEYYVMPKNSYYFKFVGKNDSNLPAEDGGIRLPLSPTFDTAGNVQYMECFNEDGASLPGFTVETAQQDGKEVYILTVSNYIGWVFIKYKPRESTQDHLGDFNGWINAFGADLNEAVLINESGIADAVTQIDYHDKMNGFIFPVSSILWEHGSTRFTFLDDDLPITDPDNDNAAPEEVFPSGTAVEFDEDKMQYYYFNNTLYTNFNLLSYSNANIQYPKMCDSINLLIDVYDDAKVDDYYLNLISAPDNSMEMVASNQADPPEDEEEQQGGGQA